MMMNTEFSNKQKRSEGDQSPVSESDKGHAYTSPGEINPHVSSENSLSPSIRDASGSSPEISLSDVWTRDGDSVRKSRTVMEIRPQILTSPEITERTSGMVSFPREKRRPSAHSRETMDSRSRTPPVPLVPSIAKSVPKKRIFLRKPKKAIKDLFGHKKSGGENAASPRTPSRERRPTIKHTRKSSGRCESARRTSAALSDSSGDERVNACEDAVSLKSFGSQAGCGEIFADEEYLISLDGVPKRKAGESAAFQGGVEQLASPAHPEVLDLFGTWETIDTSVQRSIKSSTPISASSSSSLRMENVPSSDLTQRPSRALTHKSESQESTSDEGYCDCVSAEDHTGRSVTPPFTSKLPRDSYSGDALYDLFYHPGDADTAPVFQDLPSSIVGLPSPDLPLSMYSFHIGSEEKLAPPLAVDRISQDFLQSNWVGKDCLLKLCDTEISLAMGIVNWMKHRTPHGSESGIPEIITDVNVFQEEKLQTLDLLSKTALTTSSSSRDHMTDLSFSRTRPPDPVKRPHGVLTAPESQTGTPTSHMCFRIFNIDSPCTPSEDSESPAGRSPGSGTSSLFVLAINKECLCDACKASLRRGAEELHLCPSCSAYIQQKNTSELWPAGNLYQTRVTGSPPALLPSPSSSCGIASDISILSLVEQCANQMSSLNLSQHQHPSETRRTENIPRRDRTRNYGKSEPRKKSSVTGNARSRSSLAARDPSESETLPNNGSENIVLQTNPLKDTDTSQSSPPTSLLLTSATSSRKNKHHNGVTDKTHGRSRRDGKTSGTRTGQSDAITTDETKIRQKNRIKK